MEKKVSFQPGWDKRNPDPSKNYGVHGVTITFLLIGELGAMQYKIYTDWYPAHVQEEFHKTKFETFKQKPSGVDVGYHSPKPMYEGQKVIDDNCEILGGAPCYYDGSGLKADDVTQILLEQGDPGVWSYLEDEYKERFGELR